MRVFLRMHILTLSLASVAPRDYNKSCRVDGFTTTPLGWPVGKDKRFMFVANATAFSRRALASNYRWKRHSLDLWSCVQKAKGEVFWPSPETNVVSGVARGGAVLAINDEGHDSAIVLSINGRVQCVLELERLFDRRYYEVPCDDYGNSWVKALQTVRDRCECDAGKCPSYIDHGVLVAYGTWACPWAATLPQIVESVFRVGMWRMINHHEGHALLGYHSSSFRSALVVSYDAGSDEGTFNVYLGLGLELYHIARFPYNFGGLYEYLAFLMVEVAGVPLDWACWRFAPDFHKNLKDNSTWVHLKLARASDARMADAGKLMGYAATGNTTAELNKAMLDFFNHYDLGVPPRIVRTACESLQGQRDIAAAIQETFERVVLDQISLLLDLVHQHQEVEGIVLSGGCALNVRVNQLIRDMFTMSTSDKTSLPSDWKVKDVYVSPAPNDSGVSVGGVWAVQPPYVNQQLQYLGFRLWDEEILDAQANERGARRLSDLGGVEFLAELLVGGLAWQEERFSTDERPIIGIVRGRQEFGPRALGHRSLVAVPDSDRIRERLNRLKHRQWFRPVAPMIADEALEQVFGHGQKSRFMEMSPYVRHEIRKQFPAMAHFDGTARHQSVGKGDEPWLHELLLAVGRHTGLAALINTSFNSKGKPIVNDVRACLKMLDDLPDLDYVLIEDWLFRAPEKLQNGTEFDIYALPKLAAFERLVNV